MAARLFAAGLGLILIVGLAAAVVVGGRLSAPVPKSVGDPPADLPAMAVSIPVEAGGRAVAGWLVPGRAGAGAIVLLHAIRGDRRYMLGRARFLHRHGYTVLSIDHQGHGESPGDRITFGYREAADAVAAVDYLKRHYPGEAVGVIGVSLGAAAAAIAGRHLTADALVLEAVYPTFQEAVANRLEMRFGRVGAFLAPLLVWQMPLRAKIGPRDLRPVVGVAHAGAPVLLIAGGRDRHARPEQVRAVYAAAREPKEFWLLPGAGHEDFHRHSPDAYEQRVLDFFGRHLR